MQDINYTKTNQKNRNKLLLNNVNGNNKERKVELI